MARKDKIKRAIGDLIPAQGQADTEPETSETVPEEQAGTSGTRTGPSGDFSTGKITSVGVGLRAGELALLESMAERWGVGRNFVTRWLVICGLRQSLAGTLPEPPRKLP